MMLLAAGWLAQGLQECSARRHCPHSRAQIVGMGTPLRTQIGVGGGVRGGSAALQMNVLVICVCAQPRQLMARASCEQPKFA